MANNVITPAHAARLRDFRERADYAPAGVLIHPRGWRYVPVHAFGQRAVDAWVELAGDATLMETYCAAEPAALFARQTDRELGWVYLIARFREPAVTREMFERAMERFVDLGFPDGPRFRVPMSGGRLQIE